MIKIIAEIGINHDGDYNKAIELIDSCLESGVWGIKFQYRNLNNSYHNFSKEIGDQSLKFEIKRNYISPDDIIKLTNYAKDKKLKVGISFFSPKDILDFKKNIYDFDFFKIPSVELSNIDLIIKLLEFKKLLIISTGCHEEIEIINIVKKIKSFQNWIMLHCVSNYPVSLFNAKLGYIERLKKITEREVGYSSHDENWEVCLAAASLGVNLIERHITLDKSQKGLDHSTSSTPQEFKKLSAILSNWNEMLSGNEKRILNQGEKLNKQNLGRSLVANKNFKIGDKINLQDFDYKSPRIGLDINSIKNYKNISLLKNIKSGEVIQKSHFEKKIVIDDDDIENCIKSKISLPIRYHDAQSIQEEFKIQNFEFHLSYIESRKKLESSLIIPENRYSIHLPDYISPTELIDPFSNINSQRKESIKMLDDIKNLAKKIEDITSKEVVIVGSFSAYNSIDEFYKSISNLVDNFQLDNLKLLPQWLPPIAWYFGGSVKLDVFNNYDAIDFIKKYNFQICLDLSHLFMSRSIMSDNFDNSFNDLIKLSGHHHIADAEGIDGEGIEIGKGNPENLRYIKQILNSKEQKVLEVWQGHLDNYSGFRSAVKSISKIIKQ
jgi:sialic acid synthase SpsE